MVDGREVATRAATATMLYAAGVIAGPVGPFLVPAAKELSSPHMKRLTDLWTRWQGDSVARAIQALDEAERLIAKDAEQMLDAVMKNPQLLAHFARALSAVYESEVEGKVNAMARSMATAAQDESAIDEEHLYVDAIRRLDAPHIGFLIAARNRWTDDVATVGASAGLSPAGSGPVARTLESVGALELVQLDTKDGLYPLNVPVLGKGPFVTEFGEAVLTRLGHHKW